MICVIRVNKLLNYSVVGVPIEIDYILNHIISPKSKSNQEWRTPDLELEITILSCQKIIIKH